MRFVYLLKSILPKGFAKDIYTLGMESRLIFSFHHQSPHMHLRNKTGFLDVLMPLAKSKGLEIVDVRTHSSCIEVEFRRRRVRHRWGQRSAIPVRNSAKLIEDLIVRRAKRYAEYCVDNLLAFQDYGKYFRGYYFHGPDVIFTSDSVSDRFKEYRKSNGTGFGEYVYAIPIRVFTRNAQALAFGAKCESNR